MFTAKGRLIRPILKGAYLAMGGQGSKIVWLGNWECVIKPFHGTDSAVVKQAVRCQSLHSLQFKLHLCGILGLLEYLASGSTNSSPSIKTLTP